MNNIIEKFMDKKSLKCMGISGLAHILLLAIAYILMMPAEGSGGDDFIEIKFESAIEQDQNISEENTNDEYVPDLFENLENINETSETSEDGSEEADYIQKKHDEIKRQQKEAQEKATNINNNMAERSKYGPLIPRHFYGVRILAQNVVFVVDISGSMDLREVILQLKNAYHSLSANETFSIVVYANGASVWKSEMIPATDDNKKDADNWLRRVPKGGGTNMYDGLLKGFEIVRDSSDTLFFITDGHPTSGKIKDTNLLLKQVAEWNSEKNATVQTIGIGAHRVDSFLKDLATQNNGSYHKITP